MIQQPPRDRHLIASDLARTGRVGPFDWQPSIRVVFGSGALSQVGVLALELGASRPLLVTDPGIEGAGHAARAIYFLREAGLDPVVFDGVEENPTGRHVDAGVAAARPAAVDLIIGLGGGSAMDTAKGINFVLTNGGSIADYWGIGKATQPMLPMIAIPTTAGTGSEAQSFALISNDQTHQKMACGDKKAAPKIALLDPALTLSQPARVTALVGIDALSHVLESYVTTARNPVSTMLARQAWPLLANGFARVVDHPDDLDARGMMLLGAHLAGASIENSMLGATHSLANPLTAHFGITHGLAISLVLPAVLRFNAAIVDPLYDELLRVLPEMDAGGASASAGEYLAQRVEWWAHRAGLPSSLASVGVPENALAKLASEAHTQWTARFNPRPVLVSDLEALYRESYNGPRYES
jgi:alcohol dehydrogenase